MKASELNYFPLWKGESHNDDGTVDEILRLPDGIETIHERSSENATGNFIDNVVLERDLNSTSSEEDNGTDASKKITFQGGEGVIPSVLLDVS